MRLPRSCWRAQLVMAGRQQFDPSQTPLSKPRAPAAFGLIPGQQSQSVQGPSLKSSVLRSPSQRFSTSTTVILPGEVEKPETKEAGQSTNNPEKQP